MSVTVVSCVYGSRGYERFVPRWHAALGVLRRWPDEIIVATDRSHGLWEFARELVAQCSWLHPQAFYLQQAVEAAETEWVWIVDMDDLVLPDGLDGLEQVDADVWQMGYRISDGDKHIAPQLTGAEYLALESNPFAAGSAFRTDAFHKCGGFPDAAFQDWGLWRRMAQHGATFLASDRAHYRYIRHEKTRSAVELTSDLRGDHIEEMRLAVA